MSNARFSIIQARAVRDGRISLAQFRTLCALGIYGDEEGWCFPNLKTLGIDLGKSKQAVSKDIRALVDLGYVQVKQQYREDGSRRGNLYRLLFDCGGGQRHVDGCQLNEVDGCQLNEVDALTTHINDPFNDPLELIIAPSKTEKIRRTVNTLWGDAKEVDQVDLLIERYGFEPVLEMAAWCNEKKMATMRQAIRSMETMAPGWNRYKQQQQNENPLAVEIARRKALLEANGN